MNSFFRYYNKNRETLWLALLIAVIVVVVVHSIRGLMNYSNKNAKEDNIIINNTVVNKTIEKSKQSSISNTKVSDKDYKKESGIIDRFINFCNTGKVEEAYNLLTDECKENLYPTIEVFQNNYIKTIFSSYKTYTIKNYYENTYTIRLLEDMLSTGKSNNGEAIQDYFTIVDSKLNINEYIRREKIENTGTLNNVKITALYKDIFMNYEKYTIEVYNGSDKTIKLDSLESTKSIYLVNSNNIQFPSYSHELIETLLEIPQGNTRKLDIKFYNKYITTNEIEELVFSDIILDYNFYNNRGKCTITL